MIAVPQLRLRRRAGALPTLWTIAVLVAAASWTSASLTAREVQRLTKDRDSDFSATWSPGGGMVAFASDREGGKNLWTLKPATGELRKLTTFELPAFADQPDWAPSGTEIAFTGSNGQGAPDIWIADSLTGELTQVTHSPAVDWMPAFSPDGSRLAYVSDQTGTEGVWVCNKDGSEARLLVEHGWDPVWSPDGNKLAFQSVVPGNDGVALVAASGGEAVVIAPGAKNPCWSPDGRRLCVVVSANGQDRLQIINADGTGPVALPELGRSPRAPDWSADGGRILYDAQVESRRNLFAVNLDYRRPTVALTSPEDGARLQGEVEIRGSASADYGQLDQVVVEVGAGARPTEWKQIGQVQSAVQDELLTTWDMEGLTGAYTIRLTAVDSSGDAGVAEIHVHALSEHGVEFVSGEPPGVMTAGEVYSVPLTLKNVGTMTWLTSGRYEVQVGYRWFDDQNNVVIRKGLLTPLPHTVETEQTVTLEASVKAPPLPGEHVLELDLRQGDLLWFSDRNALTKRTTVNVVVPISAKVLSSQAPKEMTPGQEYTLKVRLLNDGASAWSADSEPRVSLSYHWAQEDGTPVDHIPLFTDLPGTVTPDSEVTVAATVRAPDTAGVYALAWDLLVGEEHWLWGVRDATPAATVRVTVPEGASFTQVDVPRSMAPGQIYVANVTLENTGSTPWTPEGRSAVRLGYRWFDAQGKRVEQAPLFAKLPYEVAPGKSLVLAAQVQAPSLPGEYSLEWDVLKGDDQWFSEHGSRAHALSVLVARPAYQVEFTCNDHPARMIVGQPYLVNMSVRNLGTLTWSAEPPHVVRLGYHWLDKAGNPIAQEPLMVPLSHSLAFEGTAVLAGQVRAPDVPGQYTLKWDLYQEGKGWFSAEGANTLNAPVRVEVLYGTEFISHDTPARMLPGQRYTVHLRLKNVGVLKWEAQGNVPVQLSYQWLDQAGGVAVPRGFLTNLPTDVASGQSIDVQAQVQAPAQAGAYILRWDLLQGGMLWFADKGAKPLGIVVRVE